ncbi:hypothetical protein tb265_04740 [Gemmatimonadetes bacterium T265]|nr:hypothetical protein tb265_04740 [Gemmatimonadetes bacterium T265]
MTMRTLQFELALPAERRPAPAPVPPPPRRPTPAEADALLARLRGLGLRGIDRLRFTRNRTVMVSFSGGELRVHEGYRDGPAEVLRAVVGFVCGRTRAERRTAREAILAHQIVRPAGSAPRRRERARPEDEPAIAQLRRFHAHYNRVYFGGRLKAVPIRLSARMRTRLGHYTAAAPTGDPAEIVIGSAHIRRHGWEEALHTLLHEMVHQWQDEAGHPVDHGATFRAKAREVGITASARRHMVPRRPRAGVRELAPPLPHGRPLPQTIGLRAAREE